MRIAIIPGHNKINQGAKLRGVEVSEYHLWWTLTHLALVPRLRKETNNIYKIFEESYEIPSYRNRMISLHKEVDLWKADIAVSLHFNGSNSSRHNGFEVLYSGYKPSGDFGEQLLESLEKNLPMLPNRGLKVLEKNDRGYSFVKVGRAKALLVEPFFGTSSKDYCRLAGMLDGFVDFFKRI